MDVIAGPILKLLYRVIELYMWIVFISVAMSWLTQFNIINLSNRFVYMLYDFMFKVTEPALRRIRMFLPIIGGFDLSPIALLLGLMLVKDMIEEVLVKFTF